MAQVRLGDQEVTLAPFSGRKATMIGRVIKRVTQHVPTIMREAAEFRARYAEENAEFVTREMALALPAWQERLRDVTDSQWEAVGGVLKLPTPPTSEEEFAAIFETAFDAFEAEMMSLLALAVMPNSELGKAARDGTVDQVLRERGEELLDLATMGELIALAAAAVDHVREEFEAQKDPIQRLRKLWRREQEAQEDEEQEEDLTETAEGGSPTPSESGSSAEDRTQTSSSSSTDSPGSTDGPPASPSTTSPSETFSGSPT